jgi:hypothetical protein
MRKKNKNKNELSAFAVGDKVDVHPSYAAEHPERDCSGQAIVQDVVPGLFGGTMCGVSFPNMEPGFKFYWMNPGILRASTTTTTNE